MKCLGGGAPISMRGGSGIPQRDGLLGPNFNRHPSQTAEPDLLVDAPMAGWVLSDNLFSVVGGFGAPARKCRTGASPSVREKREKVHVRFLRGGLQRGDQAAVRAGGIERLRQNQHQSAICPGPALDRVLQPHFNTGRQRPAMSTENHDFGASGGFGGAAGEFGFTEILELPEIEIQFHLSLQLFEKALADFHGGGARARVFVHDDNFAFVRNVDCLRRNSFSWPVHNFVAFVHSESLKDTSQSPLAASTTVRREACPRQEKVVHCYSQRNSPVIH